MKLKPTRSFGKGQKIGNSNRCVRITGWFFSTEKLNQSIDTRDHVAEIISALKQRHEALEQLVRVGCKIDVMNYWLYIDQDELPIDQSQVKCLANMGIDVWWDVHNAHIEQRLS